MSQAVDKIKDRLNIVDVVAPYVELHKSGRHFKGLSPFTTEKTPSFHVSPDRGMYYCFSTSQGGDMFNFIEHMEGVDFKGALKILAEKAGVELVPERPEVKDERDRLYAICNEATKLFAQNLASDQISLAYLKKRGVSEVTIKEWQVGSAVAPPEGWRQLRAHLTKQGYKDTEMRLAGMIKGGEDGKEPFDVFRHRIMFPLRDQVGRVVAFSGRDMSGDEKAPKYVNSPETPLYHKSSLLYGYDKAKQFARQSDFWLLVEGQFDVVLAHQAGYKSTVAVSGTALTNDHVDQLQRLSSRIVLALDSDRAGIAAMRRAADLMLPRGMDIKVVMMPEGKDPADMVAESPKEFKQMVREATPVIQYFLQHYKKQAKDERAYKMQVVAEIVPMINLIPSRVDQEHFEKIVAEASDTTKEAIHFEVERLREKKATAIHPQSEPEKKPEQKPLPKVAKPVLGDVKAQCHYLMVASEVLPDVSNRLSVELQGLCGDNFIEYQKGLDNSNQALLTVTIEEYANSQSKRILYEDLTHRLNRFAESLRRERLGALRAIVSEKERKGEEVSPELLGELLAAQKALQISGYEISWWQVGL